MYSTYNEVKSFVTEIFKHKTAVSKNVYFNFYMIFLMNSITHTLGLLK